jgi:hypothetical protein
VESTENEVRIRFRSNNFLPDNTGRVAIGDYAIEQIPSSDNSEAILIFEAGHGPLPKDMFFNLIKLEANYFLSFLSLISLSNCEFQAGLWNKENIATPERKYVLTRNPFNLEAAKEHYSRFCSLGNEQRKRFVNACKRYRQAVSIYDKEPIVSFFLLVVAIECLSNSIDIRESDLAWAVYESFYGSKLKRNRRRRIPSSVKFVEFICKYLPTDVLAAEGEIDLLKKRLLSAYFIRNSFVHDGEDLPSPVSMADFLGRRSIVYVAPRDDKRIEIRAPAMLWLERIVVNALIGYLIKESGKRLQPSVFRELARETGTYAMKLRKPHPAIERYQTIVGDFAKRYFEGDD